LRGFRAPNRTYLDVHFAMMSTNDLVAEACLRLLPCLTKLTRDEITCGRPDFVSAA
jgi:hypothetical protein